ncbi:MAG TPA: hypothetical protein PLQ93_01295 [Bacteroidia bacterium]|nr:hypothetical protein [Bacteroidia bacterium]
MTEREIVNIQYRVNSKLRYAKLHLGELLQKGTAGGDDFDRAHQESFLFHLIGVKDAFVIELCKYYGIACEGEKVSAGWLRKKLADRGLVSTELTELYTLENDENSWLSNAKSIRDYSMHVSNVPRHFHAGGENEHKVIISVPRTGKKTEQHINDDFQIWLNNMHELIGRLRHSALSR